MAERGGQPGNNNATKSRPWRAALDRALAQDESDESKPKRLRAAAEALLDAAAAGDLTAIKELGDRLDGKAAQAIEATMAGEWIVKLSQSDAEA